MAIAKNRKESILKNAKSNLKLAPFIADYRFKSADRSNTSFNVTWLIKFFPIFILVRVAVSVWSDAADN